VDDNGVTYETLNNRLMYYEVYENMTLLERRDYEYDNRGNPTYIVRKLESEAVYHGYTLQYNNQNEVWFVTEQTWTLDEFGYCENPQTVSITEFRGNGRTRYMVRERNPAFALDVLSGTTRWSDYDGDEIYGDYIVDDVSGVVTDTMAYLPGVAQMDMLSGEITYFHGDQIGSVRAVSDQQSTVSGTMVYTAFGEQVYADGTVGTRYQYAGAWGYESSGRSDALADLGWLHVGHRYYNPSTGRFLQRDPIGIGGGLNVYEYVASRPTDFVDPQGLIPLVIPPNPGGGWTLTDGGILTRGGGAAGGAGGGIPKWLKWGRFGPGVIVAVCFIAAEVGAQALDADTARKQAVLEGGGGLPLPNPWLPWNWGIDDDHLRPGYVWPPKKRRPGGCWLAGNQWVSGSDVCFPADIVVHTTHGFEPIATIMQSSRVLTQAGETGELVDSPVNAAGSSGKTDLVIEIRITGESIRSTPTHPFWTMNRGWVQAEKLVPGDILQDIGGNPIPVLSSERVCLPVPEDVYDIKCKENPCYFVGYRGVLVHSVCSRPVVAGD
ncbi:MAG: RHS repeat-associated core domain-containing protein, partial [Planctomycetota bacterium]